MPISKLKIRVIDSTSDRRESIKTAIRQWNRFEEGEDCFESVFDQGGIRIEDAAKPEIVLLHLRDQIDRDGKSRGYVEAISKLPSEPIIVIYSGGEIIVEEHSSTHIRLSQESEPRKTWDFEIENVSNTCVVSRRVSSAEDLNIGPAIEKYIITRNKDEFFQSLSNPYSAPEYLSAVFVLCQGYLIAHYLSHEHRSPSVSSAMSKLVNLEDEGLKDLINQAHQNRSETENTKWWGGVFGLFPEGEEGREVRLKEKEMLLSALAKEYRAKLPDDIEKLVIKIYNTDRLTDKDDELVAGAFTQLYEKLVKGNRS
jgi:hypothetical protein